jgi:CDP-glycerol glycerophosphotransferase (TagB/SpsB family)
MNEIDKTLRFLLYISKIYSLPVYMPLALYLEKNGFSNRFYLSHKVFENFPHEWDKTKICNSLKEAKLYNPDFVLVTGNFVDFRIPGIKVQLFHGLGIEKEVHYKIRHFFDVYFTSGPYVTERYIKLQQKTPYFLIRECGWPKIDYILSFPSSGIKNLNLPPGKKIILYAPTFSTDHQSATSLVNYIPAAIQEDEFWIVKFHELMSKEVINNYKSIDNKKIKVLHNEEITPYLHAADVLISDTSSVVYEFMVLDKPIITFQTKGAKDKGIDIENVHQLRPAIDRCFNYPDEYKAMRLKHIHRVNPYTDGNISKRIVNELIQIKNQDLLKLKRKPLNLFRKIQVIYHNTFKKGYLR